MGLSHTFPMPLHCIQDVPKNVDPGTWISKYSDRLSPNAYTALAPFVGKIGRPTAPNMAVVPDFNGNLLVRNSVVWRWMLA